MFGRLGHTLSAEDVTEWLTCNKNDPGYCHLSDEEIISSVIQQTEADESGDDGEVATKITHALAVQMFDGCIEWLQQQEEASLYNISILNELRELAAKKRLSSFKQSTLTNFFQIHVLNCQTHDFLIVTQLLIT